MSECNKGRLKNHISTQAYSTSPSNHTWLKWNREVQCIEKLEHCVKKPTNKCNVSTRKPFQVKTIQSQEFVIMKIGDSFQFLLISNPHKLEKRQTY